MSSGDEVWRPFAERAELTIEDGFDCGHDVPVCSLTAPEVAHRPSAISTA